MENLTEILIEVVIPALVAALLGYALPVVKAKRDQLKASKNEVLIRIIEKTIQSGIAYIKETKQAPTPDAVAYYVEKSIPDTLAQANVATPELKRKIVSAVGKELIDKIR